MQDRKISSMLIIWSLKPVGNLLEVDVIIFTVVARPYSRWQPLLHSFGLRNFLKIYGRAILSFRWSRIGARYHCGPYVKMLYLKLRMASLKEFLMHFWFVIFRLGIQVFPFIFWLRKVIRWRMLSANGLAERLLRLWRLLQMGSRRNPRHYWSVPGMLSIS